MITSDAVLNLLGVAVLGFVFWKLGSFGKERMVAKEKKDDPIPKAKVVKR